MNATKYRIGKNQNSRRKKAKTTPPTIGRICRVDEMHQRCKRDTERPTEIHTNKPTSDGFLRTAFLPKLKENDWQKTTQLEQNTIKIQSKNTKMERDFYQSLSLVAKHYNIELIQTRNFGYPYNISLALDNVQKQLKKKVINWEEIRLIKEKGKTYFISEERYATGETLYYIPILPLYRLSKNPKRKQSVQLLQSVCSYLYHIVKVPYYRKQDSYLFWMYEMVSEWLTSDEENEEISICLSEIKQAEQIGDFMEKKLYNHHNLSLFKERLKNFKAKDRIDNDCFMLARKLFSLYQQYPNASIYQNLPPNTEIDEQESFVSMEKYISFCAEDRGSLFQSLFEAVNTEFQEYGQTEEPIVVKKFDGNTNTNKNLDFENRIFPLIEELICILSSF